MAEQAAHSYRFGSYRIDTAERVLMCGDELVRLAPKIFETLLVLVERSGHVVSKNELMERVWPDCFVEESNLVVTISELRKTLSRTAGGEKLIETVAKRGYRFVGDVGETGPRLDGDRAGSDATEAVATPPHNLAQPLTTFVGRTRQVEEVRERLVSARLVTLTGVGGMGKTRLALEIARRALADFPDGVWFVDLARLSDPALVPEVVARTLRLPESSGASPTEMLRERLREKSLLLVLDNCEHVMEACAALAEAVLPVCPGVRLLATSRERLGVAGEVLWPLPALTVPNGRVVSRLDRVLESEAGRLFLDRAALVAPGFTASECNGPAIAQLCRELDGIPLAIELAAARANVLSPEQMVVRLGEWFRLLKGIGRATAPRHQTLKAAIDWSYDLLSQEERVLMARLSVFAGGCTLEAAEAVCAGGALGEDSVLDLLGRLADKSLITTSADGAEMRYRQLETIRQYGWERLGESDQWEAVIDRYVGWYVELFDRTEGALAGPDAGAWYARFEREHDNLRAVLRYLLRREADRATFLRVCERLWHFWDRGPHLNEARTWFEAGLADTTGVADAELARPLLRAGELAAERGDPATAVARMRRASDLCSRFDRRWQGICLSKLAAVLCKSGRVREGLEVARTCLALARELGASDLTAIACNSVGIALMYVHEYREAEVYFEESLAIAGEPRRAYNSVVKLVHLGLCALLRGDLDRAEKLCDEGLAVWADLGAEFCVAATLATKGYVSLERGSLEEALARFRRSIAMFEQDNARSDLNQLAALAGVACVHAAKGEHRRALRVYGATARLVGEWGAKLPPGIEALHRRYLDLARHAIGDEEADRALAEGSAMNAEQAME